jgi:hypothetical protein
MVCGAYGRNTHLRATKGNQFLDPRGFRRRMDGHTAAPATDPSRMLDPLLRRVSDEDWSRREPALHLTLRGAHEVLVHLHFLASKNMTEYEALLCGL